MRLQMDNLEADTKLHQKMVQSVNQPQSYIFAEIEKTSKELDFANRKIKQMDDVMKKLKHENEQLKNTKKVLAEDLHKLTAKRADIENLQTTLMGIMQHSTSKKIDVSDLKGKLAESVRRDKYSQPFSAETSLKKAKKSGRGSNSDLLDMDPVNDRQTMKMYNQQEDTAPAWFKKLNKQMM